MRLTSLFSIPFQFFTLEFTSVAVGMELMVLSQFSIFAENKPISKTLPSIFCPGKTIQSPTLIVLEKAICIPEINPKIVSLKIRIKTAVSAPKLVNIILRGISKRMENNKIAPKTYKLILIIWAAPSKATEK